MSCHANEGKGYAVGVKIKATRDGARRCVYCHDAVDEVQAVACSECGVELHAECRLELRRCTTIGCQGLQEGELGEEPEIGARREALRRVFGDDVYVRARLREDSVSTGRRPGEVSPPLAGLAIGLALGVVAGTLLATVSAFPGMPESLAATLVAAGAGLGWATGFAITLVGVRPDPAPTGWAYVGQLTLLGALGGGGALLVGSALADAYGAYGFLGGGILGSLVAMVLSLRLFGRTGLLGG